ncbi:MAG: NYN domain-containing protein [Clostridia bacterium]|nr:NYN domain-containing protein [Clostridia bacterium]
MNTSKKYVVLADIESVRVPFTAFAAALDELSQIGEIAACKFYGYSAKRTKDYGEFIQENNFDALSALPKKRKGKLDLRQVIDAVRLAQFPNIDGFFLIYGKGDITPLIAYLKSYGMDVIAGVIEPDKNSALCNKVIVLDPENPYIEEVLKSGYKKVDAPIAATAKKAAKPRIAKPVVVAKSAPSPITETNEEEILDSEVEAEGVIEAEVEAEATEEAAPIAKAAPAPAEADDEGDALIAQLYKLLGNGE